MPHFSIALASLGVFLVIAGIYGIASIGRSSERVYTGVCVALLIAIAGLCGYHLLTVTEHALAVAARV